jgi:preprotein translocase subunit SecA
MIDNMGLGDDAIESKMVTKSIENAQKKVEGNNFDTRKTLLGYDDVMNMQREVIYGQRQMVLEGKDLKENIRAMLHNVVSTAVNIHLSNGSEREEGIEKLITYMEDIFVPHDTLEADKLMKMTNQDIEEMLYDIGVSIHEEKEQEIGEQIREIERVILLKVVDTKWMEHINNMDHLKRGIGLRAYKQQDPVQAYQFEGSEMFDEMINSINNDTIKYILHIAVRKEEKIEREQVAKETSTNQDTTLKRKPVVKNTRVGRNDPCPCGSGKKYKNCHGAAK